MLCVRLCAFSLQRECWWLSSRIGASVVLVRRNPKIDVQQSSRIDPCQSILAVPSIILDHNNLTSRIGLAHQPPTTPFRRSFTLFIFSNLPTSILATSASPCYGCPVLKGSPSSSRLYTSRVKSRSQAWPFEPEAIASFNGTIIYTQAT